MLVGRYVVHHPYKSIRKLIADIHHLYRYQIINFISVQDIIMTVLLLFGNLKR